MSRKRVAVLMGGWNVEREVSLSSGGAVIKALHELGHEAVPVQVTRDLEALQKALTPRPDVVFNALHGVGGEDGVIQGLLEIMGIPYTHSGVLASSLAMHKVQSRKIFEYEKLVTPVWKVISLKEVEEGHPLPMPYVLKPVNEGSSLGVYIIRTPEDHKKFLNEWAFGDKILAEKFIEGREIQVAIMGEEAIGAIEITPHEGFYDYTAKYTPGKATHLMPAPVSSAAYQKVLGEALKAHRALGCRGITRVDFIYEETKDQFYLLEVNTQPGMTPLSLVQEIAACHGIAFNSLISWMLDHAQCDH